MDKPIVRPNRPATALRLYGKSPEEQAATLRRLEDEIDAAVGRKLLLLAERYGIKIETGHEWRQVCLRLAQECEVAGFRIVEGLDHERPGRPKGSSEIDSFGGMHADLYDLTGLERDAQCCRDCLVHAIHLLKALRNDR